MSHFEIINSFNFLVTGVTETIAITINTIFELSNALVSKSKNPLLLRPKSPFNTTGINLKSENLKRIQPKQQPKQASQKYRYCSVRG